jgi:hypothetical protein
MLNSRRALYLYCAEALRTIREANPLHRLIRFLLDTRLSDCMIIQCVA